MEKLFGHRRNLRGELLHTGDLFTDANPSHGIEGDRTTISRTTRLLPDGNASLRWLPFLVLACFSIVPLAATTPKAQRAQRQQSEVLFLSFSDPDLPDIDGLIDEAETQLLQNRSTPIHFTLEYLDPFFLKSAPGKTKRTLSFLEEKYQGQVFDLVITIAEQTPALGEQSLDSLFPDAPLVFCVVSPSEPSEWSITKPGRTGVIRNLNYLPTLQFALAQTPGTHQVVVIAGSSEFERLELKIAHDQFPSYEPDVTFQYWTDLRLTDLKGRLSNIASDTIILFLDFMLDIEGEQFVPSRVLPTLHEAANRPIYGTMPSFVARGVVGGSVADLRQVGRILGQDGARILNGQKPETIPVHSAEFQRNVFDWRELYRWRIGLDRVPAGSSVLYWEYSPWELYRWRIFALSAVLVLETLLIFLLLYHRAIRRRAEEALRQEDKELSGAQRLGQMGSWYWNPETDTVTWSDALYTLLGVDPKLQLPPFKQLSQFFTPESWPRLTESMEKAVQTGEISELELEAIRPDGHRLLVMVRGDAVHDSYGRVVGLRGTMQDITERKHVEEQLRESQERLTAIVASAMDAIIAVDGQQRIVVFNAAAEKTFGCSAREAIGNSIDRFIPQRFCAVHREHIRHFGTTQVTRRAMGTFSALRANGEEFPIEASISHVVTGGGPLFTVIIRDITERLRAEEAVRESEKRFRLMAESAPVLMWMSGTDKLCTDFNDAWLRFTGRNIEQELGEGWTHSVHPDDLQACLHGYTYAFEARKPFTLQYRLLRHDGQYRWILHKGVPRFLEDGQFAGYIGCCVDITEQKELKAVQAELGGRLMRAQEEERAHIARELHDDINQRLALLATGIQELEHACQFDGQPQAREQLHSFWQLTSEIAADLQQLSHQLHPSKLHYLGLAAATRGLCQEFSKLHRIEVECIVRDLPAHIDEAVSLSLFRTAQESLRNVAKHSHAHLVKVELTGEERCIRLRISDDGVGFNYEQAKNGQGLGLVSIKERLKLVGGQLSVWSRPSLGTQVEATVPLGARYAQTA